MVAHSPIVAGTLIAERHATFRRQAAEDRVSRMARLYARLARRNSDLLADGSVVARVGRLVVERRPGDRGINDPSGTLIMQPA